MAKLTLNKQSYVSTASNFISVEAYREGMALIQKRIDQFKRIQKAKNWKNSLTK